MIIMLIGVAILFGLIFGWKGFIYIMTQRFMATMQVPAVAVTTMKVRSELWQPTLKAVASLRARVGVNVTTELAGMVQTINFVPGSMVKKGDVLVQLNAAAEIGLLHSLQAQVELAKITYKRDQAQYAAHAVSKQTVDSDEWNLKNLQAQVEQQFAIVEKKTIRAPFSGHIGINNVNPGQYLNVADKITTLQALDPIYADFYLPQQALALLKLGQKVSVVTDAFPKLVFRGTITTIEPEVDTSTRNVRVEATVANPTSALKPGMFATAEVDTDSPQSFLTVPQSAISFNPYGEIAFIVQDTGKKDSNNKPILVANQVFVKVGETRGDQIAILEGLKLGDTVVTSGQLKLKNGSRITIDNSVQPSNNPAPQVKEQLI